MCAAFVFRLSSSFIRLRTPNTPASEPAREIFSVFKPHPISNIPLLYVAQSSKLWPEQEEERRRPRKPLAESSSLSHPDSSSNSMGAAEKLHHHHHHHHIISFNFHFHGHGHGHENQRKEMRDVPKGCMGVMVGQGEERQRFVIPVMYVNHPLFGSLLKEAEEEFGFDHKGPISIPCHVEQFRSVQDLIHHDRLRRHHHHHHRLPLPCRHQLPCFGV